MHQKDRLVHHAREVISQRGGGAVAGRGEADDARQVFSAATALAFLPLYALLNWGRLEERWPTGIFAVVMTAAILLRHRSSSSVRQGNSSGTERNSPSAPAAAAASAAAELSAAA